MSEFCGQLFVSSSHLITVCNWLWGLIMFLKTLNKLLWIYNKTELKTNCFLWLFLCLISVGKIWSNWMSAVRVVAPQSTIEQLSYGMFVYTGRTQTAWATEIEIKSDPTYTYSNSSHLVWYSSVAYCASRSPFANENKKRKTTAQKTICIFFSFGWLTLPSYWIHY